MRTSMKKEDKLPSSLTSLDVAGRKYLQLKPRKRRSFVPLLDDTVSLGFPEHNSFYLRSICHLNNSCIHNPFCTFNFLYVYLAKKKKKNSTCFVNKNFRQNKEIRQPRNLKKNSILRKADIMNTFNLIN